MDLLKLEIKTEQTNNEVGSDTYLKPDFEVDIKLENDSPIFQDWCIQNAEYEESAHIACEVVKEECDLQTCFICLKMFVDSYSLYKHNITHLAVVINSVRLYQCDHCQSYFTSRTKIRKHMQSKHFLLYLKRDGMVTKKLHECLICHKQFTYKRWHEHMNEAHSTGKIKCADCNITFKCIRYLRRHLMHIHENIRPSWRFRKGQHNDPSEVKCKLCPAVFSNNGSYTTHLRNCHSDKAYECTLCHSKLKCKSYLYSHMRRVHYNDGKIHKCNICYKEFRSPRYLNIHKKNSHRVIIKA